MVSTSGGEDDLHANAGPQILGAIISTWAIALVVLILRFVSRRISRVGYWADDWLVLAAFIFHTAVIGLFVASVAIGAGKHVQALTKAQYTKIEVLFLSGELVYNFAVNLPKLSILAFYWRIFSVNPGIKRPVQITGGIVTLWILISCFILVFQCSPPSKLAHPEYAGHCLSKWGIFVGGSIPNLFFDVVILVIPIPFIVKLQVGSRQKIFLVILFFLGGLACVSSALRLWAFATRDYTSDDLTWTAADPIIWSCVEGAMAIIAACVLSLRPILTYLRTGSATPTPSGDKSSSRRRLKPSTGRSSEPKRCTCSHPKFSTTSTMTSVDSHPCSCSHAHYMTNNTRNNTMTSTTIQEPTIEESMIEEPIIQEKTIHEPTIQEPTIEKPAIQEMDSETEKETGDWVVPMALADDAENLTALPSIGPEGGITFFIDEP